MKSLTDASPTGRDRPSSVQRFLRPLVRLELWAVALAVLAGMAADRYLPLAPVAFAVFCLLRLPAEGRLVRRTPADWALALLLVMVPVTLWATAVPEKTHVQVYRLLGGIALLYALNAWPERDTHLRFLVFVLIAAGLGLALSAPLTVEWAIGKLPFIPAALFDRFAVLVPDSIHPNVMGAALALLLPLPLAVLLFAWGDTSWLARLLAVFAAMVIAPVLVLTQSRGAWMGFAAGFALLLLLRWRGWGLLGLLAAAGLGAYSAYRLGFTSIVDLLASGGALGGLDGRLEIWSRAIYMIQDFPFTGVGFGSYGEVADLLYPFFMSSPGGIPHAHNIFLQVAVDLGIPGLIAWLSVLLAVLYSAWRVFRPGARPGAFAAAVAAGLLAGQLALVVHGLTDAPLWGMVKPAPLVWAAWGLAFAAARVYLPPESVFSASEGPAPGTGEDRPSTAAAED